MEGRYIEQIRKTTLEYMKYQVQNLPLIQEELMAEKNYIISNKKVRVNYKSIFMCMTRLKYVNMLGTCKFGQC